MLLVTNQFAGTIKKKISVLETVDSLLFKKKKRKKKRKCHHICQRTTKMINVIGRLTLEKTLLYWQF